MSSRRLLNDFNEFTFQSLRERWWRVEFEVGESAWNPPEERKASDFAYCWVYRVRFR